MARASRRLSKTFGDKSLGDVSDADIRALVSNNVAERQYLDFKAEFDHKLPDAKPKLLRHAASFANGGDGYLILGIRDDGHGRAQRFEALQGDVESIVKRIRSLCLKYLDPRISGLEVDRRVVDGHAVVLVRIPRSARVPHMMTFNDATEFWSRYEDGKAQMTREEIREAFQTNPPTVRRRSRPQRRRITLVRNGGFEQNLEGWGTGLLEDMPRIRPFASAHRFVPFGGAVARWFADARESHSGRRSLRVEHESTCAPHVFSTLSQRVPIERGAVYEAQFWAGVEEKGAGAFSLRAVTSPREWDRFKVKIHGGPSWWRAYRLRFSSEDEGYVDIRFAAEWPVKAWIDDVAVRKLKARR
ncbi:MAG: ATP-binding protein [Candidatus Rokubacteria bacterium]|nr:ATP-binding protein [Candidatus Rokubacteria bacterium]